LTLRDGRIPTTCPLNGISTEISIKDFDTLDYVFPFKMPKTVSP